MDAAFWHGKWERGEIGFHESTVNPLLKNHFHVLQLQPASRIFVPLCGKTLDIGWLLELGHHVVGVELSQLAIDALFDQLDRNPVVMEHGGLLHYSASGVDIFVGDVFALTTDRLGTIDAIYDRAALVALPSDLRIRYAQHLKHLSKLAPQLLITYEYDQSVRPGPPFSLDTEEVARLYGNDYELELLQRDDIPASPKGRPAAAELVWHLKPRHETP